MNEGRTARAHMLLGMSFGLLAAIRAQQGGQFTDARFEADYLDIRSHVADLMDMPGDGAGRQEIEGGKNGN